jgi:hypothetical protein
MVDITKAFVDLIRAQSTITDLVGTRIYNDNPPQGIILPCIAYWIITDQAWGDLNGHIGLEKSTFQCDSYGKDRTAANNLAYETWRALDPIGHTDISGVHIHDVSRSQSGVIHLFDPVSGGTDQRRFIASQSFEVSFNSVLSV